MRGFSENYLTAARDYAEFGAYREALALLARCREPHPLLCYYRAYYAQLLGQKEQAAALLRQAEGMPAGCCFPNRLQDIPVLRFAIAEGCHQKAPYYLGCLYYDKLQWEEAVSLWEQSAKADGGFPTVWRNLALAYYNKAGAPEKARVAMEKAFSLDKSDARVFLELMDLYQKLGMGFEQRLGLMQQHLPLTESRDDLYIAYITLLNLTGQHERALSCLKGRRFHPWEGGEGKVTAQYVLALLELGKAALADGRFAEAERLLRQALSYPQNLGEGKLEGTKDNHLYYYLGEALQAQGREEEAAACWRRATAGTDAPAGALFYNDQPADMILYQGLSYQKLGETGAARSRFYRLIDYGERHLRDEVKMEYFAVSLPDLLIFDEDYTKKNRAHCLYLMALGNIGLGEEEKAAAFLAQALEVEPSHAMARCYQRRLSK